jgi:carbamoyl-phosphate synthase small subunit
VAYDFGIKRNILRLFDDAGCRVTVVPASTPLEGSARAGAGRRVPLQRARRSDAIEYAPSTIKAIAEREMPMFGICSGISCWASPSAPRREDAVRPSGGKHPVREIETGRS